MSGALLIGYGNELRGDDAAGPKAAAAVSHWQLPGVRVLVRHQLTPELAEEIAGAGVVIFVDAALAGATRGVEVLPVEAPERNPKSEKQARGDVPGFAMTHATSPEGLLTLARELYGHCPTGWMVSIPGRDFEFGERLSPQAEQGVAEALRRIRELCGACPGRAC
jgi:hydrogenase maturation protease